MKIKTYIGDIEKKKEKRVDKEGTGKSQTKTRRV